MAEAVATGTVLAALVGELAAQGFGNSINHSSDELTAYPVHGTLDVSALAEAVETALGGGAVSEDAKKASDLNAANDG